MRANILIVFTLLAGCKEPPTLVEFPEIGAGMNLQLPFDVGVRTTLVIGSDQHCDDRICVSLSQSPHDFDSTETGWFRNYPSDYYGVIISHRRKECFENAFPGLDPEEVRSEMNQLSQRFLAMGEPGRLRLNREEQALNSNFVVYSTTWFERGDSVRVLTAENKLFRVEVIDSKHDISSARFDSMAVTVIRSIKIR